MILYLSSHREGQGDTCSNKCKVQHVHFFIITFWKLFISKLLINIKINNFLNNSQLTLTLRSLSTYHLCSFLEHAQHTPPSPALALFQQKQPKKFNYYYFKFCIACHSRSLRWWHKICVQCYNMVLGGCHKEGAFIGESRGGHWVPVTPSSFPFLVAWNKRPEYSKCNDWCYNGNPSRTQFKVNVTTMKLFT